MTGLGSVQRLRELDDYQFEQFIADVWQECQGWSTEVMPASGDKGIDVLGIPPEGGKKTAVQCKCFARNNAVSGPDIQQYASLRQLSSKDIHGVTVVTTGRFTTPARQRADELDVKLISAGDLEKIVDNPTALEILSWYESGKPGDW